MIIYCKTYTKLLIWNLYLFECASYLSVACNQNCGHMWVCIVFFQLFMAKQNKIRLLCVWAYYFHIHKMLKPFTYVSEHRIFPFRATKIVSTCEYVSYFVNCVRSYKIRSDYFVYWHIVSTYTNYLKPLLM